MYDVAIIGCGVIGAATAYALSRYENKVVILEAENDVADCTTKANSAILHAGYDPAPGTKMARLNVRGVAAGQGDLRKAGCSLQAVRLPRAGSVRERAAPPAAPVRERHGQRRARYENPLTKEETLAMEPNLSENVCGALWAPSAAIVSPWEYALAMTEVAVRNGVELRRSCRVEDAEAMADGGYRLTTTQGTVEARYVINAAGIWAEKVHCMVEPASFHITPTRGEYYLLDKSEGTRVNHVIFQCPNELGKGVLVSPTVHGNLIVGPDAVPVHGDDTSCTSKGLEFVKTTAQRSVPSINFGESIRNFAGVRANLDVDDFIIGEEPEAPGWIDLAGMKSPGLSAAPAVAEEAVGILKGHGALGAEKADYKDGRRHIRFKELSAAEKAAAGQGAARLRPGHLPLRDHHRGRDPGSPPQRGARHHHRRRQAPRRCRHGPLPGRFLRPPRAGADQPGAGHRPLGHPAGQERLQRSGQRNESRRKEQWLIWSLSAAALRALLLPARHGKAVCATSSFWSATRSWAAF